MPTTKPLYATVIIFLALSFQNSLIAQGTRLLRQPSLSNKHIAFEYGADIWIADKTGGDARRITSTQAVEADPHLSPDGLSIAFTSNRSGEPNVYIVSIEGGTPVRLTWYPAPSYARGWSPDGKYVLYASTRETSPTDYTRLWIVPAKGGPSQLLAAPFGFDGSFSPDGKKIVVDRVTRWDVEWRGYRGGQNTALQILDLNSFAEKSIPNERTYDKHPVWQGNTVYFLSDRDDIMNIWSFDADNNKLNQVTNIKHTDIKWLDGNGKELVYELNGYLHLLDLATGKSQQLNINVNGDFPWAETRSENVTSKASSPSLSPTGKRILVEARGEIFTVPVENGDVRNITQSAGAADRRPIWSSDGKQIAWFSDAGGNGYALRIAS